MTNREFYTAIANAENLPVELTEFASAQIEKMDAANAARKNKPSKAQIENAPLLDQIVNEILTVEPKTASDVATALDVKVQKASALLRQLVAAGRASVQDIKVPKRGTVKAYTVPTVEAE